MKIRVIILILSLLLPLFISCNEEQTKVIDPKYHDYVVFKVVKSSHPTINENMQIFMLNGENKVCIYYYPEPDSLSLGKYNFFYDKGYPYLSLQYKTAENKLSNADISPVTEIFEISGSNTELIDLLIRNEFLHKPTKDQQHDFDNFMLRLKNNETVINCQLTDAHLPYKFSNI